MFKLPLLKLLFVFSLLILCMSRCSSNCYCNKKNECEECEYNCVKINDE
jgi:hypothetical protein